MDSQLQLLIGKTIKTIHEPLSIIINGEYRGDDIIVIEFTDGTVLKMGSSDYEGYSSSIEKEVIYGD